VKTLLLTTTLIAIPVIGSADEPMRYKAFYNIISGQTQEVGDLPGHFMSLAKATGLAQLGDGEVVQTHLLATTDFASGSGPFNAYVELQFSDGSALWTKMAAQSVATGPGKADTKGTMTIIGGKGRFAGAQGDGTMQGGRFNSQTEQNRVWADVVLNVKK
jgi:hypothetical protein